MKKPLSMTTLLPCHNTAVALPWTFRGLVIMSLASCCHGNSRAMISSCEVCSFAFQIPTGMICAAALLWQCRSVAVMVPNHCQGNGMVLSWHCHDTTMVCHREATAISCHMLLPHLFGMHLNTAPASMLAGHGMVNDMSHGPY